MGAPSKYSMAADIARAADALEAFDDGPSTMPPQGQATVATAGTRVQLVVASTPLRGGCYIIPYPTNTGVIYVGGSGVTSSNGVRVGAGMILPFPIDDANKIYLDASVSGEGASFISF